VWKNFNRELEVFRHATVLPYYYETRFLITAAEAGTDKAAMKIARNVTYFNAKIDRARKEHDRREAWIHKRVKELEGEHKFKPLSVKKLVKRGKREARQPRGRRAA